MKTTNFLTGLVMAAVLVCSACGNPQEKKLAEINKEIAALEAEIKSVPVPDDKVRINHVLYQISDVHKVYDHRGFETQDLDFGHDNIEHDRVLFPKETGGFEVGYVVKTSLGVVLQANKAFYFYNGLALNEDILQVYTVVGIVRADGSLIPAKVTIPGNDNPIMRERKDSDVLTFEPLIPDDDVKLLCFTVQELKEYCKQQGLKPYAVPYLLFTDE